MKQIFGILATLALLASCGPRYVDYYPYHEDGRSKPSVVLLPIQDDSESGLSWNLGQELDQRMEYRLLDDATLFLVSNAKDERTEKRDYFGKDLSFARQYGKADFVVAMELIEHKVVPYGKEKIYPLYPIHNRECENVLMMKMRVRVLDIRGEEPVIVLQEIHQSNHMLPKGRDRLETGTQGWGTESYPKSPYAIAHQQMMNDITHRFEQIIQAAH